MSYVLLVDDEPDILEVLEMTTQMVTSLPVRVSASGNKAWKLIMEMGEPAFVVCDYRMPDGDGVSLFVKMREEFPQTPFVVCSGNPLDELKTLFPEATGYVVKPQFLQPLKELMAKFLTAAAPVPDFVSVPIGHLLRLGVIQFDAYIRISDGKYVKVHQSGCSFDEDDFQRLQKKLLTHLFVNRRDAFSMLEKFQSFLMEKMASHTDHKAPSHSLSLDAIEATVAFGKALGWGPEVVKMAQATVDIATKHVASDKNWQKIFKRNAGSERFSYHISTLSLLCCAVAQQLGWESQVTHQKLVMAAMLHDHFVDPAHYAEKPAVSERREYEQHPLKAAEFAMTLASVPGDVDKIISQHHELPDGSGFPRKLSASQIAPLSALFIICESLVSFSMDKTMDAALLNEFWEKHQSFLQHDPFKKIALSLIKES